MNIKELTELLRESEDSRSRFDRAMLSLLTHEDIDKELSDKYENLDPRDDIYDQSKLEE